MGPITITHLPTYQGTVPEKKDLQTQEKKSTCRLVSYNGGEGKKKKRVRLGVRVRVRMRLRVRLGLGLGLGWKKKGLNT